MHLIAGLNGGRVADNRRAVGVPADGVAASEDRERAQAVETRGRRAEPCVRGVDSPIG
jgi:hypothetical protein